MAGLTTYAFSQKKMLTTNTPVYIAALNHDKSILAFADVERITIVQSADFSKINEWSYDKTKSGIVSKLSFHPLNKDLLMKIKIRKSASMN